MGGQERRSDANRLSVTTPDRADPVVYGLWHQAPVVATAGWPAELYVESQGELRSVLRSHGVFPGMPSAERVAVCPSRYGWSVPAQLPDHDFPVANHVVVALDLAQDRGRVREILEEESGRPRSCLARSSFSTGRIGRCQ
jgi:hypothetical protein